MIEEGGETTRKEFGYRMSLINQIERIGQLSSTLLLFGKKSGKISKVNMINIRYAIRNLAYFLQPYWDNEFKTNAAKISKQKDTSSQFKLLGEILCLMKRNRLLLEKEYELDEEGELREP